MNGIAVDVASWVCAGVSVVAGALVFYVDSMARATYALALSFVAVGVALLLMGQAYMGVIVVLMMVMEMGSRMILVVEVTVMTRMPSLILWREPVSREAAAPIFYHRPPMRSTGCIPLTWMERTREKILSRSIVI